MRNPCRVRSEKVTFSSEDTSTVPQSLDSDVSWTKEAVMTKSTHGVAHPR